MIIELDDELLDRLGDATRDWLAQVASPPNSASSIQSLMPLARTLAPGHPNDTSGAGQRWAIRFVGDVVAQLGPRAFSLVSELLQPIGDALNNDKLLVRGAAASAIGSISARGGAPFGSFVVAAVEPVVRGASVPTSSDAVETFARDCHIAARAFDGYSPRADLFAVAQIIRAAPVDVPIDPLIPRFVAALPIERAEPSQAEVVFSLLIELLARGHDAVSPEVNVVAQRVVAVLAHALEPRQRSYTPTAYVAPIRTALDAYLHRLDPSFRAALSPSVQSQLGSLS